VGHRGAVVTAIVTSVRPHLVEVHVPASLGLEMPTEDCWQVSALRRGMGPDGYRSPRAGSIDVHTTWDDKVHVKTGFDDIYFPGDAVRALLATAATVLGGG
jgi:hypothetical protein